jgi:hypothetical protein
MAHLFATQFDEAFAPLGFSMKRDPALRPCGPLPSDAGQFVSIARYWVSKRYAMDPELEAQYLELALDHAQRRTELDRDLLLGASNIKLLAKNPKSNEHARELWEKLNALDAEHVRRRSSSR